MRALGLPPTALSPLQADAAGRRTDASALAKDLAALGYPALSHLRQGGWQPKNPARVLVEALNQDDLEARLAEGLPWLVREAKLRDLQNRLGFVVTLARQLAERARDDDKAPALAELEARLERSRLAREEPFCRTSLPEAERRWLADHRSAEARRWNLLTDWTADALRYVA